jgi:hypothetical protein
MSNHNEQSDTLTRQEYKGKIYVKEYLNKFMYDPKQDPDLEQTEK